jgi:hypothetical protein
MSASKIITPGHLGKPAGNIGKHKRNPSIKTDSKIADAFVVILN